MISDITQFFVFYCPEGERNFFLAVKVEIRKVRTFFFCGNGKFFVILHHEPIGILAEIVDRS